MPNGVRNREGSNFDAWMLGVGYSEYDIWLVYFVVPDSFQYYREMTFEDFFKESKFIGTRSQCEENLIDYPNCKII